MADEPEEKQPARLAIEALLKVIQTAPEPSVIVQACALILNHTIKTEELKIQIAMSTRPFGDIAPR